MKHADATTAYVPLLGRIAAGAPVPAQDEAEVMLPLPLPLPRLLVGEGELFALKVVGQSMMGTAILEGDIVTVRRQDTADHGDIVAALLDGGATVKRLRCDAGRV